jgi:hypothetical protein
MPEVQSELYSEIRQTLARAVVAFHYLATFHAVPAVTREAAAEDLAKARVLLTRMEETP